MLNRNRRAVLRAVVVAMDRSEEPTHAVIRAALGGQEGVLETETLGKDGQNFFVELRYLPVRFGDGEDPDFVATIERIAAASGRSAV